MAGIVGDETFGPRHKRGETAAVSWDVFLHTALASVKRSVR